MAFPHDGVKFQPGQSGNLNGVPKGTKHISTWIQDVLEDETLQAKYLEGIQYRELDGKTPPIKAIVKVATVKAMQGDQKWADWLAKYGYAAKVQLGNDPDNPLTNVKQLSDEELNDRFRAIIADAAVGNKSNSLGAGQTASG